MKASVLQENFLSALKRVSRVVDSKPVLPVLANIYMEVSGTSMLLGATNIECLITTQLGAKAESDLIITLPAKTLMELVAALPAERIDMTLDPATWTVTFRCGTSKSTLKGISPTEWPTSKLQTASRSLVLDAQKFLQAVNQVSPFVAREDSRPILTGANLKFEGDLLYVAGSDGYRLGIQTLKVDNTFDGTSLTIPLESLHNVTRLIEKDTTEVIMHLYEGVVLFNVESTSVRTQVLDGRYPDYMGIVPKATTSQMTCLRSDLLAACKRAVTFSKDTNWSTLFTWEPTQISVLGKSAERGDATTTVEGTLVGDVLEQALNVKYIMDALAVLESDSVMLSTNGPSHACVLEPVAGDGTTMVMMPMSTGR